MMTVSATKRQRRRTKRYVEEPQRNPALSGANMASLTVPAIRLRPPHAAAPWAESFSRNGSGSNCSMLQTPSPRHLTGQHHDPPTHRRHTGGVADGLGIDFPVAVLVVADVVDVDLLPLAVLDAAGDDTDAGLTLGQRAEAAGIGKHRLEKLEGHDLLAPGTRPRRCGSCRRSAAPPGA